MTTEETGLEPVAPLGPAQEALWFIAELAPRSAAYNINVAFALDGEPDVARLHAALRYVAQRHRALSSVFRDDGVRVVHVAQPQRDVPLDVVDIDDDAALQETLADRGARPYDLRADLPLRATLVRTPSQPVLLVGLHHIAADAGSVDVVVRDLGREYAGDDAAPPMQYADLVRRRYGDTAKFASARQYWLAQLDGAPHVFELPAQHARPPVRDFAGATFSAHLPSELAQRLRQAARSARTTPAALLLAAYQCLLQRHTGLRDFLVGMPVSTRTEDGSEDTVGLLVNTVALRARVHGGDRYDDVLARTRRTLVEALDHAHYPFAWLVGDLRVARDTSREPLTQVSFNYVRTTARPLVLGDVTGTPVELATDCAKNDWSLQFIDDGETLRLIIVHDRRLFERDFVERWHRHYLALLDGALANPQCRVCDLPLLDDAERRQLTAWNDTAAPFAQDGCLHRMFEAQVDRTPGAVALAVAGATLTYADLDRRANRLAHRLRALGVGPDTLVAICAGRSFDLVAGLLGILKAGGAYVPLDPAQPRDRLARMLQDSGAGVLLAQAALLDVLPPHAGTILPLDDTLDEVPDARPSVDVNPWHLACCLYTSGSTGTPKGVALPHRAIVARLAWMQSTYGLGADDRLLQKTSSGFDVSLWEVFWTLSAGARLHLPSDEDARDVARLVRIAVDERITFLHFTPAALAVALDDPAFGDHALRFLVSGGDVLGTDTCERALRAMRGHFHNRYGPTEAAINATCWTGDGAPSIGRPIANTTIHLLDDAMNPVPVGVPGEIHIGGAGLARGYHGRPDLTAAAFVPDPFGAPGSRLYRSGDLGRRRADGSIEFLGRLDRQVKLRGFRIEPGEVEHVLRRLDGVRDAVVEVRGDGDGKRLVGWVVAESTDTLRDALREHLPDYMIPAAIVRLDALPLTANGKVDRARLIEPDAAPAAVHVAPRDALETALAAIWADVLRRERVGVHDDFFALGGDSLRATQIVSRVRGVTAHAITVRDVFLAPTVAAFAARLAAPSASIQAAPPPLRRRTAR